VVENMILDHLLVYLNLIKMAEGEFIIIHGVLH